MQLRELCLFLLLNSIFISSCTEEPFENVDPLNGDDIVIINDSIFPLGFDELDEVGKDSLLMDINADGLPDVEFFVIKEFVENSTSPHNQGAGYYYSILGINFLNESDYMIRLGGTISWPLFLEKYDYVDASSKGVRKIEICDNQSTYCVGMRDRSGYIGFVSNGHYGYLKFETYSSPFGIRIFQMAYNRTKGASIYCGQMPQ